MHYIAQYKRGATRVCLRCRRRMLVWRMVQAPQPCGSRVWRCKDCKANHRPRKPKVERKAKPVKRQQQQPTESRIIK